VLMLRSPLADEDAFVREAQAYAALGVTEIEVMPDRHPVKFAEQIAQRILPRVTDL
jgi:hypothetical protein